MKKNEKNTSIERRTICTRSLAASTPASVEQETPGLRRSNRGTPSTKLITPPSATRKSERLAPSSASLTKKSGGKEKKNTPSPLRRSDRGKNVVSLQSSKGSDNTSRNADTSLDIGQSNDKKKNSIEESTNKIKKREPIMSARSFRALFRGKLKESEELVDAPSKDEGLLVVGCSRRIPAGNDDAQDGNKDCPPPANSESEKLPVGETSLETNVELPLKRKRDTAGIVLDSCAMAANGDGQVMSSDGVVPSPSGCQNKNQPEMCNTCGKRLKVNSDIENLSDCSCIAQPVEESDHVAQDTEPATSKDSEENRQMQQDKSSDPKLHPSMYPEYWVPVQLSDVQLEQYCRTLFSKSLSLSLLSKYDLGALEEALTSVRKTCDHPYVLDASLKQLLTKNLELHEILDVEIKASGKLHLLDAMLTHIQKNGLKAVVFYQATQSPEGLLLGNILEDFVLQKFGQKSYEHGIYTSKKNAINNFNKESQCCVLLLETRACSQTIKLLRAEAFILFGSSLNPSHDVKHLEKIKIESGSERTKIFRLYSVCTAEEKALILARQNKWQNKRQNKAVENLNRPLTHALLMWGAPYLFDKLDHFHGSETPDPGASFEQSIREGVIHEFSSILSSKGGEENEGKLRLLLEAKHAQGTYSSDSTLFGEEHIKLSDEGSPNIFWTKLLGGKNPMWKYHSDAPQRNRKRVQYFEGSEESPKIDNGGNTKKRKKVSNDVTDPPVDNDERKASGKDHMGALESPKVIALQSSCKTTSGTMDGNNAFGLYSVGGYISGIPEDMLAGHDWRKTPRESQRRLLAVLKPEMAKLCQVLHLSEDWTSMVESFLEYVIENHRIYEEPTTLLLAFQIALSWIAALLVKQNLSHKKSLICAKSELAFDCSVVEVNYIYSILFCMKSLFLERTQGLQSMVSTNQGNESLSGATVHQEKNNTKSMLSSSEGEECMTEKRCSYYSTATKDIEKTISYIKKKCKKQEQKLVQEHEEKRTELLNMYADKKHELETRKKVEAAVIRISSSRTSTKVDDLKRLDHEFERKFDEIKSEKNECLISLEQMHEDAKKRLAEDEACWINRIKNWAQAELKICGPIESGIKKHFSGICSSNTSKNAPDVRNCNDANFEVTYADTNCSFSKGNQVPEAENTPGTIPCGSTQHVHELIGSRNDKTMNVSTLSGEQPTDNVTTKSQSNEHATITVPEILIPAGCQEEFAALNMHLSRGPEVSQPLANLAKSASPAFSLNREEALVPTENNRTSHVGPDADNILDQENREARSLDKEIPDELGLPMPTPASVVETRGAAESDQDDQDICPTPSSPAGKQPDPAANTHGQNIEAAIEPQSDGSDTVETTDFAASNQGDQVTCPLPSSSAGNQPVPEANIEGQNMNTSAEPHVAGPDTVESGDYAVSDQGDQVTCPLPSSSAGNQPVPEANIEGQNMNTSAEPHVAGPDTVESGDYAVSEQGDQVTCPLPSSPAGNQPVPEANIEGQNMNTSAEPHVAGPDTVESGDYAVSDQGDQVTCPLPSSPAGNQPVPEANIEGQNMNTSAELHVAGPDAVESGDYAVSDQDACSLPSALVGTQSNLGANIECQNITTVAQLPIDGSDAVETSGSPVSDQGAQDAYPLPSSSPGNHPDAAANIEGLNNTMVAEPFPTASDACEMEIQESAHQVEQSTYANLVQEGGVELSAGVTASVPSLFNNGTGQSAVQPVPQIPFPVFNDPFLHELEKLRRESETSKKTFEEKKSILKAELERKMAEVQAEFQRKFNEVEAEHKTRTTKIEASKNLVIMNKLLANAFLSKCTDKKASPSAAPSGRIQQLAQRAAQVGALRNYTAPAHAALQLQSSSFPTPALALSPSLVQLQASSSPAPGPAPALLQPQASSYTSSVSRPSGLPLNSTVCPMPQPRQPLISNTAPTPSASPATNQVADASLRSPAPHISSYRPPPSIPVATAILTSSSPPQALTYSAEFIQQQQQQQEQEPQQSLRNGLQGNNDVVCLSDDE